ncbi:MAG: hypothetical protein QM831_28700 [Kofleriaceae bacterium]
MTTYLLIKLAIAGVILVTGLGVSIQRVVHSRKLRQRLLAAPQQFEDNAVVTLTGTVKQIGEEQLTAPLSGRTCVAFMASARTYAQSAAGFGTRSVRAVELEVIEAVMLPFLLITKEGNVLVDGEDCLLPHRSAPIIPRKLERERRFLNRLADGRADAAAKDAGFDELVVTPGMKVRVHGVTRKQLTAGGGDEVGFRDAPMQIHLTGHEGPLVIDFD